MSRELHTVATTTVKKLPPNTIKLRFGLRLRMIFALALVAGIIAVLSMATFTGSAANPSSGTLTPASGTLTYTSGPFLVSNPSGTGGAVICSPAQAFPCDEYALTVSGTNGATHNIVITTSWANTAEDFDIYLRQGTTEVKNSASSSDPEVMTVDATPGTYTIRIVPFAVAGGTTTTTVALVAKPVTPPPPPPGPGTPRYQQFAATGNLGNSAGEPSIGTGKPITGHPEGRSMYIAGLETLRVTWDDCSSPARPLWEDVSALNTTVTSLDPILFTDFVTGRTFASQLAAKCSNMSFTDNDGGVDGLAPGDWTPSQGCGINSGVDHQTVGGGPFEPALPNATGLYANAVYYASQDVAVAQAAISRDGGLTFGPAVPMYNLTECGGLHGHIKVAPDGTVYMPNKGCGGNQGVVVSTNEGITWTVRKVPGTSPGDTDPSLGIDANGKLYFAYANGDGHAMVAVSSNKGVTWSTPIDVGAPFNIKNTVFPAAVAGDAGRAAVMYLATDTGGNYEATGVFTGVWHIYVAHTFDGGATWTTVRATPDNDPVQRGSICTSGTTCSGGDRNLLDFNDITLDHQGRTLVAFADGCIGCTSPTGADSRSDKATIARQSGGKRLIAAFDPNPAEPAVPAAPRLDSVTQNSSGVVHVDWSEPDNGGSPLTGYNVYRRTSAGTYGAPLATVTMGCPSCKTEYDDTTAVAGTAYFYKVTALNLIGESTNCGELPVGAATVGNDPCIIPGVEILTDQSGDIITPIGETTNGGWDLRSLSIAEPYAFAPDKLVFTVKVEDLTVVPPNTRWPIQFRVPGDPNTLGRWVDMSTIPPASPAAPVFRYGTFAIAQPAGTYGAPSTVGGNADAASTYSADGTIRIVVPRSNIGNPAVGQNLTGFLMRVRFGTDLAAVTPDNMPDSLAPSGSYTVVGNDPFCRPNSTPIAVLTGSPTSGNAPLLVNFDGSGSYDLDTDPPADTIASYTFNFGDGSPEETRTVAMFGAAAAMTSHTYNGPAGEYPATLRVTDSRGKVSTNLARVVITVNQAPTGPFNYARGSNGGVVTASSSHSSGNFPALAAINGDRNGASWGTSTGGWNDNTRGAYPDWLEVAFSGAPKTIDEIRVYTLQNNWKGNPGEPTANTSCTNEGILDFKVETLALDGITWVTQGTATGNTKAMRIFTFPEVTTSKVRVVVTASRTNFSRIIEFEAFGASGQ